MSTVPAPASDAEAIKMILTGLSHLAAADHTATAAQAQAECLQALEQGDAISTAARAGILAAFTAGRGYSADAEDAMRRLVASGLLPERAGQPVKVWAHVSLAELRALDDGSVLAGPRSPPVVTQAAVGAGHWAAGRRRRALAAWASAAGSGLVAWGLGTEAPARAEVESIWRQQGDLLRKLGLGRDDLAERV